MSSPEPLSDEWMRARCGWCHVSHPDPKYCTHPRVREVAAAALRWAVGSVEASDEAWTDALDAVRAKADKLEGK